MIITDKITKLTAIIVSFKKSNSSIGFVPTMGSLHDGHLSLINTAIKNNKICIVSIFVNPTQFNNQEDLEKYPRTIKKDLDFLRKHLRDTDIVFNPDVKEMYPEEDNTTFNFGQLENVLEGKFRKGHFKGVAIIINKFFEIIKPDKAYFGLKDLQQYIIIKSLVKKTGMQVDIVPCPTMREKDGLAMSSRNVRLSKNERNSASLINIALKLAKTLARKKSVDEVKKKISFVINSDPNLELEYFEIVDKNEMTAIKNWNQSSELMGCIAVNAGKIRLIDNIEL